MAGFSSGVMGAMTLVGNVTGALIGFFFPVSVKNTVYDHNKTVILVTVNDKLK